eukprot:CAMPEP_0172594880 /NCGR_PEP_ID=MMETSP1068-20121228/14378_1 /TAXON_ID=35684 /ORGANISM="Pseudopedinella elastica, Strain CCMP716" /LENGTH=98 /DNA_ID=CAMNT_0013393145 /DNA_START=857 /DNA_END=1149 /DNA_ORIENTATION=-
MDGIMFLGWELFASWSSSTPVSPKAPMQGTFLGAGHADGGAAGSRPAGYGARDSGKWVLILAMLRVSDGWVLGARRDSPISADGTSGNLSRVRHGNEG